MHYYQRTLKRPVSCTGIGLHSGKKVNMRLRPADPDTGVVFKRVDQPGAPLIPADAHHVIDTTMCTTVGRDQLRVSTVEHLISALAGLRVDNVLVEVDSPEVPVMDGSAAPFVFLIKSAGLTSQARLRQYYRVNRPFTVQEGDKFVSAFPAKELSVGFTIEFDHPLIRRQELNVTLGNGSYAQELSRARTFGFLEDLHVLRRNNLALGGSLDNAVVVDEYRVLNDDGLRFADEFVRHKILDFIGDIAMIGRPVVGEFHVHKSGHSLNHKMVCEFLKDPQAWRLVTPSPSKDTPEEAAIELPVELGAAVVA